MDIEAYFNRIGYAGTPSPTLACLREVLHCHPLAIPFENIDSLVSGKVSLSPDAVFNKLVTQGRGGYCFEQNRLLADMLTEIGFEVSTHAARVVWHGMDKALMPRTHMLLKIALDGDTYIADAGFGGLTMTGPVRLEPGVEQDSPHEAFRIDQDGDDYRISARLGQQWKAMYYFDLSSYISPDFELANYYVSTHPESRFVSNLVVARPFRNGRHALLNNAYTKYSREGVKTEKTISDPDELMTLLTEIFNIRMEASVDTQKLRAILADLIAGSTDVVT